VERMTWLTEERIAASATGAPSLGRLGAAAATRRHDQIQKQAALVPSAYGPGLVCASASVCFRTNDHTAMGRTAWDGLPLGSRGDGIG
jgi:hypothetical protein